jgi:hypothetical protein
MVAVLLPAARVARRHLEMSFRDRTDPHVAPRGRDHERAEAADVLALADDAAVGIDVRKAPADSTPANAGHRVRDIPKPCRFRGCDEISRWPLAHVLSSTVARDVGSECGFALGYRVNDGGGEHA